METVTMLGFVAVVVGCSAGGLLSVMGRRAAGDGPSPWPFVVVIMGGFVSATLAVLWG